ncbi:MAG: hypothetical protein MZV65_02330 [Chromatiales bacterium]|nr:hypothetical protein [Chromatiales bacterium]
MVIERGAGRERQAADPEVRGGAGTASGREPATSANARGKGLMGALEAVKDKATKTLFPGDLSVSERIANSCTECRADLAARWASPSCCCPPLHHDGRRRWTRCSTSSAPRAAPKKVFAEVA